MCRYKCVIVLCDSQWCDPDMDSSNGIQMGLRDMLRIDSMLMMVQLNIRVLLEVSNASHPGIHHCPHAHSCFLLQDCCGESVCSVQQCIFGLQHS